MGKVLLIVGIIAAVLIAGLAFAYFSITGSPTVEAQVHIEAGKVLINGAQVTEDSKLKEGDAIETGPDGKATVMLYESVLISLEGNTKITLDELTKEHPKISQESGETWNKFTKLSGVQEYSASSGNSVASVRGTAFGLKKDKIITGEGEVEYEIDGKSYNVPKNKVVEKIGDKINEREANQEEKNKINENNKRTIEMLRVLREKEIEKHPKLVDMVKSRLGVDDAGLRQLLEDADNGDYNIDELAEQSPIELEAVNKIAGITKKIIELKAQLA